MEKILAQTAPSLDVDIKDYLLHGVLSDPDCFNDLDSLRETLQGFIEEVQIVELIMSAIESTLGNDDERSATEHTDQHQRERIESNDPLPRLTTPLIMAEDINSCEKDQAFETENDPPSCDEAEEVRPSGRSSARASRKERRQRKQRLAPAPGKDDVLSDGENSDGSKEVEESWGGRGKGGRGEYAAAVNSVKSNIHLSNVSILLDNGLDLLTGSVMDIVKGHRYGLIGRNGVGK